MLEVLSKVFKNDPERSRTIQNDPERSKTIQNDPKRSRTINSTINTHLILDSEFLCLIDSTSTTGAALNTMKLKGL